MDKKINTSGPSSGFIADPTITPFPINWNRLNKIRFEDAPTDYILLCKLVEKYNEVVTATNSLEEGMEQFMEWVSKNIEDSTIKQLNKWLDDGTLSSIIQSALAIYDTVADMIADDNLQENSYAFTKGYFTKDDLGGNTWIVTSTVPDNFYVKLSNGLYAKKVKTTICNIMQYGVKANLETDQSSLIQQALNENEVVYFNSGIYFVKLATPYSINLNNNNTIIGNDTTIKGIGSYDNSYYTILNCNADNLFIKNIKIDGAKELVTVTGEHGMCTTVQGSNIKFENCIFQNAFGDGATLDTTAKNIVFESCEFTNCRRQGISICAVEGVVISNCIIHDISGTSPQSGIDIEPYEDRNCKNIIIQNTKIYDCAEYGIIGYFKYMETKNVTMIVNNVEIKNCNRGIVISNILNQYNQVEFNNIVIDTMVEYSIYLVDIPYALKQIIFKNIFCRQYTEGAVQIISKNQVTSGIYFENIIFARDTEPFNNTHFSFNKTVSISDIQIINTNADYFENWTKVENLVIKNNPLVISSGTTVTYNKEYHNEIYIKNSLTLMFNNIIDSSDYVQKTAPIKIYIIGNIDFTLQTVSLNQSLNIIGSNGTKVTGTSGGSNITIQGINNLLCITDYNGNWISNT